MKLRPRSTGWLQQRVQLLAERESKAYDLEAYKAAKPLLAKLVESWRDSTNDSEALDKVDEIVEEAHEWLRLYHEDWVEIRDA